MVKILFAWFCAPSKITIKILGYGACPIVEKMIHLTCRYPVGIIELCAALSRRNGAIEIMKTQSVVALDPIDRKKSPGILGRFFMTRHFRGKRGKKTLPFGHYLFVGKQRQGKTVSAVWYMDLLKRKFEKKGFEVKLYTNLGIGEPVTRSNLFTVLNSILYDKSVIHIMLIDEIQSYFPKDTRDKVTLQMIDQLTGEFSQLGKRQIFVLSTAQVYGRLNKSLREQCLYMVNCRLSFTRRFVNDFIDGDDVICDELGRWAGCPSKIYVHGLPKTKFDTHKLIKL